jgi:hypothetical protein
VAVVTRRAQLTKLNRKEWQAFKRRDLDKMYTPEKVEIMVSSRLKTSHLWYADGEFPDDKAENFYWIRNGDKFRQDDEFVEAMEISGDMELDSESLSNLVGEGGILQAGSAPAIQTTTEEGQKAFADILASAAGTVAKVGKPLKKGDKPTGSEELVPKTPLEPLS